MKMLSSILVTAGMAMAAPVAAAPSAASKLSVAQSRTAAPGSGERKLAEGAGGIVALALVAGIAAIVIVGALADDNDDDNAVSA